MEQLSKLREAGALQDIDLELCRFLRQRNSGASDNVLLAACLLSYLYRQGDVCLQLSKYAGRLLFEDEFQGRAIQAPDQEEWLQALKESPLVGQAGDFKPLILDQSARLYMHKLWHYEDVLARQLISRSAQKEASVNKSLLQDGLNRLFPDSPATVDWQRVAAASSVKNKLSVISGGPGTGKTSTVVRILALLLEQSQDRGNELSIALAAPTGKAAARLKDSIVSANEGLATREEIRSAIPDEAKTIHQLLGARRHSSAFKHDADNPVPYDLVIVDEASMVDQALMSKLTSALLEDSRLILLGDKDQLASVEAGSVLGDICDIEGNYFSGDMAGWLKEVGISIPGEAIVDEPDLLTDNITLLTKSYRFDQHSGIARLADAVNGGQANEAIQILTSDDFTDTRLLTADNQQKLESVLQSRLVPYFRTVIENPSPTAALDAFGTFQILAAHRRGPWGIESLNRLAEQLLRQEGMISKYEQWYAGKPVIINVNNYRLGLHNGDIGICLPDRNGDPQIHFRHEDDIKTVTPGRLPDHNKAFALTVHKSQGSEFDKVLLVLPDELSQVLSRELLYTAITRARTAIEVLAPEKVLSQSIKSQIQRSSGLRDRLWKSQKANEKPIK
ncbi:MAG: exodeoxyribonuclease V subunit alpha [Fodinibius sp.]|nr:exodeoxyribonuclease V subunit alpha [Fodinibius sp.]